MSETTRKLVPPQLYSHHFSQIKFRTGFQNCVRLGLNSRKWNQVEDNSYTLQWCEKERVNDVFTEGISGNQRVNHFRLYTQLCRKDLLIKNIRKYKKELGKQGQLVENQWNFHPATFFLPSEYVMFSTEFQKNGGLYIMKPTGRCQGVGIFLVNKLSQVQPYKHKAPPQPVQTQPIPSKPPLPGSSRKQETDSQSERDDHVKQEDQLPPSESYIIQKYISNPLLFGMKKFDLRIYVLCTNYSQLTVWLYRSGFARFTHEPYNSDEIENLNSHLTNVAIQKNSENYDEVRGGKWLLHNFKNYLMSRYGLEATDECFLEIHQIIIRSLRAVQKSIIPSKSSFELYGYDFMIDANMKPWLIEVNGGPSMTANTDFDCRLKCGLVDDVLSVVNLEGILTGNQQTVGGFDLIVDHDVNLVQHEKSTYKTFLGAKNQREKVMKKITHEFLINCKKQKEIEKKKKEHQRNQNNPRNINKQKLSQKPGEASKPQKLLPNFYYFRKMADINIHVKAQMIEDLQILESNQNTRLGFTPIGMIKS